MRVKTILLNDSQVRSLCRENPGWMETCWNEFRTESTTGGMLVTSSDSWIAKLEIQLRLIRDRRPEITVGSVTFKSLENGKYRMFVTAFPWSYCDLTRRNAAGLIKELRKVAASK